MSDERNTSQGSQPDQPVPGVGTAAPKVDVNIGSGSGTENNLAPGVPAPKDGGPEQPAGAPRSSSSSSE